MWRPFSNGASLGVIGSEGGAILRDDELEAGARITLEETPIRFAITCGIYGWMAHTRFFASSAPALAAFEAMKCDLARIVNDLPSDITKQSAVDHTIEQIEAFIERYP